MANQYLAPVGSAPAIMGRYEFVVVSSLRAHQLMAGCIARIDGNHKLTRIACMEVAEGKVAGMTAIEIPRPTAPADAALVFVGSAESD